MHEGTGIIGSQSDGIRWEGKGRNRPPPLPDERMTEEGEGGRKEGENLSHRKEREKNKS